MNEDTNIRERRGSILEERETELESEGKIEEREREKASEEP